MYLLDKFMVQCSISVEKKALQLNLELGVLGGGPFDFSVSLSPKP